MTCIFVHTADNSPPRFDKAVLSRVNGRLIFRRSHTSGHSSASTIASLVVPHLFRAAVISVTLSSMIELHAKDLSLQQRGPTEPPHAENTGAPLNSWHAEPVRLRNIDAKTRIAAKQNALQKPLIRKTGYCMISEGHEMHVQT